MKLAKSLLLGAAAGIVAISGAQAADLPVKAKPVQYVKICSLYGAGFFYIPGTDTCLKIGGFARSEWDQTALASFAPAVGGVNAIATRATNSLINRSRFVTSFDVRSQTEYGTLRGYTRTGYQWTTSDAITGGSGAVLYLDRAFLQLGGWTFGKTQSFADYDIALYSNETPLLFGDTGGGGTALLAYTATLGNGLTATISAEDHWETQAPIVGFAPATGAALGAGAAATTGFITALGAANSSWLPGGSQPSNAAGIKVPDLVANLHVEQAWGSAQVTGMLHNNSAAYYSVAVGDTTHPGDAVGWAVNGGAKYNLLMLGKGDSIMVAAGYCNGAVNYCHGTPVPNISNGFGLVRGGTIGIGWYNDAYYSTTAGSSLELSKAWDIQVGGQHVWNAQWQTSLWGVYNNYKANSTAVDTFCTGVLARAAGCADFSAWQIGSRTLWNPVPNMDISLEVMYIRVKSALAGQAITGFNGTAAVLTAGDTGTFEGILRFQRNFWP
jgi:hypothetical protein